MNTGAKFGHHALNGWVAVVAEVLEATEEMVGDAVSITSALFAAKFVAGTKLLIEFAA